MQRTNRKDSELLQLFLFCIVNSLVKSCFYSVSRYHILRWNKAVYKRRRNTARACARDSRRGAHVEKRLQRFEVDGDFFWRILYVRVSPLQPSLPTEHRRPRPPTPAEHCI